LGRLPSAAEAQPPGSARRIGVLLVLLSPAGKEVQAFRQGLRDGGYVEGRDVVIEWRSANGDYARLQQLAADLVARKVDVIVADTTPATQAARRATSTIPIVMAIVADPVGSGWWGATTLAMDSLRNWLCRMAFRISIVAGGRSRTCRWGSPTTRVSQLGDLHPVDKGWASRHPGGRHQRRILAR
jgi:hypothetical protein